MICFSDLDRTLIYSKKFIDKHNDNIVCIELKNEKEISYTSYEAICQLKKIIDSKLIIPTTTRCRSEYERILFSNYDIKFNYAIVSNGAHILKDNQVLTSWETEMKLMKKNCENIEKISEVFKKYSSTQGIERIKNVEDDFLCILVDSCFSYDSISEFVEYLDKCKWSTFRSGRKIYFMPNCITKEAAINYLMETMDEKDYFALGDSILDLKMLKRAKMALIPKHASIEEVSDIENKYISYSEGIKSAEEMLNVLLNYA